MPSGHLILCHPLLLLSPIPPSIRLFSNEASLRLRWPKYWNFTFSTSPSNEHPELISFRMDWLDKDGVICIYLGLLIFPLVTLIPAYAPSNPVFLMMYSTYKLNNSSLCNWCFMPVLYSLWNMIQWKVYTHCQLLSQANLRSHWMRLDEQLTALNTWLLALLFILSPLPPQSRISSYFLLTFSLQNSLWIVPSCFVPSLSHVWLFMTPCTAASQASLSFSNS